MGYLRDVCARPNSDKMMLSWRKNRIRFIDLYIVFYIFIAMSGSSRPMYLYVVMGLLIGLLILFFFNIRIENSKINNSYYLMVFYLLYIFIVGLPVAGFLFTAKQVGAALIFFSPLFIYHYYKTKKNEETQQFILKCIFIILVYYLISAYFAYTKLSVDARKLASGDLAAYGNLSIGGGYNLAYAITLIAVYLFDRLKNRSIVDIKNKVFYIVFIIFSSIVIFETKSTITLLAYSIGLLSTILVPISNSNKIQHRLFFIKLLLFVIMIIALLLLKSVIGNIIIKIGRNINNILGDRVQSLGYLLLKSDAGFYAASRIVIPINSFKTFLKYPIFGIAHLHGNSYLRPILFGAGNHCEWVDALTNWGLVGGIPFLYIFFSALQRIYKKNESKLGIGLWITFIVLGLFNPFQSIQTSMVLFLVLPLHTDLHNLRKNPVFRSAKV